MVSSKEWSIINISLGFIAALLLLNLVGIELPSLGQALYALDKEQPIIMVEWQGELASCKDLNRCCFDIMQLPECTPTARTLPRGEMEWSCSTQYSPSYWLNNKAYAYCARQPFWRR